MSLEPRENLNKRQVPLKAVACISKVNQSQRSMANLRGRGWEDVEWYSLTCVESLWAGEGTIRPISELISPPAHLLDSIAEHITPEKREGTRDHYRLSSAHIYAMEKWKAVILYTYFFSDEVNLETLKTNGDVNFCGPDGEWPRGYYLGDEPKVLFASKEAKEAKGFLKDRDVRAQVSASQVRDRKLSEVLGLVDRDIAKFESEELQDPNIRDQWGNERSEVFFDFGRRKPKLKRLRLTLPKRAIRKSKNSTPRVCDRRQQKSRAQARRWEAHSQIEAEGHVCGRSQGACFSPGGGA